MFGIEARESTELDESFGQTERHRKAFFIALYLPEPHGSCGSLESPSMMIISKFECSTLNCIIRTWITIFHPFEWSVTNLIHTHLIYTRCTFIVRSSIHLHCAAERCTQWALKVCLKVRSKASARQKLSECFRTVRYHRWRYSPMTNLRVCRVPSKAILRRMNPQPRRSLARGILEDVGERRHTRCVLSVVLYQVRRFRPSAWYSLYHSIHQGAVCNVVVLPHDSKPTQWRIVGRRELKSHICFYHQYSLLISR